MNKGKTITVLVSILIVVLIIYIGHRSTLGKEGVLTQASNVEIEYNKKEIIGVIKSTVNEKYLAAYNSSKEDASKKIEDFYNPTIAIEYLVEKGYLEYYYYKDIKEDTKTYEYIKENITKETKKRDDIFYINVSKELKDINQFGKGEKFVDNDINKKDIFTLEKSQQTEGIYIINYYNLDGNKEEIGQINFKEPI